MTRAGKSLLVLLLAAVFALRLLTPAGFMPAFDGGAVAIVACPDDGAPIAPASHHHQGHTSKKLHQPCPYAAAAGMGALGPSFGALIVSLVLATALLLGRTFLFVERHRIREHPPSQGPPLNA